MPSVPFKILFRPSLPSLVDENPRIDYYRGMEVKLFLPEHVEPVFSFEKNRLDSDLGDIQVEMHSWDQPWRKESLEHYSSLGWSFVALDSNNKIQGYSLGQPILFFNSWTQTLWVEHLSFADNAIGFQLLDTLVRWSKTKHLQKVLFNSKSAQAPFVQESMSGFAENGYLHLSTTKIQED